MFTSSFGGEHTTYNIQHTPPKLEVNVCKNEGQNSNAKLPQLPPRGDVSLSAVL